MIEQLQLPLQQHPNVMPGELVTKITVDQGRKSNGVEMVRVDDVRLCMGYATEYPRWDAAGRRYLIETAARSVVLSEQVNGTASSDFNPQYIDTVHPLNIDGLIGIISKNPQDRNRAARDVAAKLMAGKPSYREVTFFGQDTFEQVLMEMAAEQTSDRNSRIAGRLASALALGYNYLNREIPN